MTSWALIAAAGAFLALPGAAGAAPRPDLQVRAVSTPSLQEAAGSRLAVAATVRNAGDRTAPPSRLGFYLSRDRRKGRGDFRLRPRARLRARRPGTRVSLRRTLTMPQVIPVGRYALLACADDTRRVRERRERNNCRSATRRLPVVAPTRPTPFTPTGPFTTNTSLQLTGPTNGSASFDATPSYSGTARSVGSVIARVEVAVDGGPFSTAGISCSACGTAAASWTFTSAALADGLHSFGFRAVDAGGRVSPAIVRTLRVDTAAPIFVSISATGGSASVTATFSEPLACSTVNPFDFTAEIGNAPVAVNGAGCSGSVVTLTLASAPGAGATVEVALVGVISDPAGNVAPAVTRSDGT